MRFRASPVMRLLPAWRLLLEAAVALYSLRFVVAAVHGAEGLLAWANLLLIGGPFVAALIRPHAAFAAFAAAFLWINGLAGADLLHGLNPLQAIACGLSLGWLARDWRDRLASERTAPTSGPTALVLLAADAFGMLLLASLALQLFRHCGETDFRAAFFTQADFFYGHPYYFLKAALLWLQGLVFFQRACTVLPRFPGLIERCLVSATLALACSFAFQLALRVPEPLNGYAFYLGGDDISSFGSLTVALMIFWLAMSPPDFPAGKGWRVAAIVVLPGLVVVSWSRAAWLAAIVFTAVVAALRLPRRWTFALLGGIAAVVVCVNLFADRPAWRSQPYLFRLAALVRFESLDRKDETRVDLFRKAVNMIQARPWSGHGIGSFYLTSRQFARPGDPLADKPDFAHNVWLQVAAEQGIPAALLLASVVAGALGQGLRRRPPSRAALACTLALGAYLMTGLTGNSLNVYPSNQFFFWLVLSGACVVAGPPVSGWPGRKASAADSGA